MAELEHLSYSSVNLYCTCSRAWYYKYIKQAPTRPTPSLVFGSAMHDTIEAIVRGAAETPTQLWTAAWSRQIADNPDLDWQGEVPEALCNDGIRILNSDSVIAGIRALRPTAIEQRVELAVPGVPVPVIGYIDLIEDGVPADIKTSNQPWTQEQAEGEIQPLFYLAALNQANTPAPDNKFRHYVLVKTKIPQWQVWETKHAPRELFWLFRMIADVWYGIEQRVFVPNPGSWRCSPKRCDFWSLCRGRA